MADGCEDTTATSSPIPTSSVLGSPANFDLIPATPQAATPVKSLAKKRKAKAHDDTDDEDDEFDEFVTPKKKARATATPKTTTSKTITPKPRQRKVKYSNVFIARSAQANASSHAPAKNIVQARSIARSYDESSEHDKMLIDMRDAKKDWREIRAKWQELTGEKTGTSTLPNRYARLKSNFTVIKEEDHPRLMESKIEVEAAFQKEKWGLIAQRVLDKGGDEYQGVALQRQYKKIMLSANVEPPAGVNDPDFDPGIDAED